FRRAFEPNKDKRFGSAREMVLRFEQALSQLSEIDDEDSFDDDASTQLLSMQNIVEQMRAAGMDPSKLGALQQTEALPDEQAEPDSDPLGATLALGHADDDDMLPTRDMAPAEVAGLMETIRAAER